MPSLDYVSSGPPIIARSIVLAVNNLTVKFNKGLISVFFFCQFQIYAVFPVALSNTVHRSGRLEEQRPTKFKVTKIKDYRLLEEEGQKPKDLEEIS